MKPLAEWPLEERRRIRGVLTDIDDTLTTHGKLLPDVLAAIQSLSAAGYKVVAVTGRPTYWAMPMLRLCGFDAVIAENGASAFWPGKGHEEGRTQSWFYADAAVRRQHRAALEAFSLMVHQRFPEVSVADDAPQRVGDLAFDIGEYSAPLPSARVAELLDFMRALGFHATSSSIHAHASLAPFCKQVASENLLQSVFGISDEEARATYAFVGDSGNDARMFAHYPFSIGVANVAQHLGKLPVSPQYVAARSYGAGFVEVSRALLDASS
jgi:HAD superfamily hydrolase (TIGR01484 family)